MINKAVIAGALLMVVSLACLAGYHELATGLSAREYTLDYMVSQGEKGPYGNFTSYDENDTVLIHDFIHSMEVIDTGENNVTHVWLRSLGKESPGNSSRIYPLIFKGDVSGKLKRGEEVFLHLFIIEDRLGNEVPLGYEDQTEFGIRLHTVTFFFLDPLFMGLAVIGAVLALYGVLRLLGLFRSIGDRLENELYGALVIAEREFHSNIMSIRMVIIMMAFAFAMLGGAYGVSSLGYFTQDAFGGSTVLGPNETLSYVAHMFIYMVGPLLAIVLSFNSITKEKSENSLLFLLCRPLNRRSVALGKYLGVLTAIAVPMVIISVVSLLFIAGFTGKLPSIEMSLLFIIYTVVLVATYVTFQQTVSTLANTSGTAILGGIGIWLVLTVFWQVIVLMLGMGGPGGGIDSSGLGFFAVNHPGSLLNPSNAYRLSIGDTLGMVGAEETVFPSDIPGIPSWAPLMSALVWFVASFIVAIEVFNKRIDR